MPSLLSFMSSCRSHITAILASSAVGQVAAAELNFERDIAPILEQTCL
jgi:hypothetical protein